MSEEAQEKVETCEPVAVLMCTDTNRRVLSKRLKLCVNWAHCCRGCDGLSRCKIACSKAEYAA